MSEETRKALHDLLDPHLITRDHFPTAMDLLVQNRDWLADLAKQELAKGIDWGDSGIQKHLEWLAAKQPYDAYGMMLQGTYLSKGPKAKEEAQL